MIYFIAYIIGFILFIVYDAVIGFGFEFDGGVHPPLVAAAIFWPIAVPILILHGIGCIFSSLKEKRLTREKTRLRIKKENEQEVQYYLEQVDAEIKKNHE